MLAFRRRQAQRSGAGIMHALRQFRPPPAQCTPCSGAAHPTRRPPRSSPCRTPTAGPQSRPARQSRTPRALRGRAARQGGWWVGVGWGRGCGLGVGCRAEEVGAGSPPYRCIAIEEVASERGCRAWAASRLDQLARHSCARLLARLPPLQSALLRCGPPAGRRALPSPPREGSPQAAKLSGCRSFAPATAAGPAARHAAPAGSRRHRPAAGKGWARHVGGSNAAEGHSWSGSSHAERPHTHRAEGPRRLRSRSRQCSQALLQSAQQQPASAPPCLALATVASIAVCMMRPMESEAVQVSSKSTTSSETPRRGAL